MNKDVDVVSRYIDPLINKYFVIDFDVHTDDIRVRPFAYNFDVFLNYANPRHVKWFQFFTRTHDSIYYYDSPCSLSCISPFFSSKFFCLIWIYYMIVIRLSYSLFRFIVRIMVRLFS